jgi:Bacterial nucleoid DNA-binding protein
VNRTELIAAVAEKTGVEKKIVEKTVRAFLVEVTERVANKEKVQLAGFGTFEARNRAARTSRNPHTGKEVKIAAVTAPAFKVGKTFKTVVAEKTKTNN